MIRVANWFLTRRCNLKCSYCRISKNYNMPTGYNKLNYFYKNEMNLETIKNILLRLKKHNPEMFHCFLGGEPLMRNDISDIINFSNENNIEYTITSNCTLEDSINKLFESVDYINSFTASIDPEVFLNSTYNTLDEYAKSVKGLNTLIKYKDTGKIKDVMADVVITSKNIKILPYLLTRLNEYGITAHIGIISQSKNNYYDYADDVDEDLLLTKEIAEPIFNEIIESNLNNYLMGDLYLKNALMYLPDKVDCEIEKDYHNISIDADAHLRFCTMIKGIETPKLHVYDIISENGNLNKDIYKYLEEDKKLCYGCTDMCIMSSKLIDDGIIDKLSMANKGGVNEISTCRTKSKGNSSEYCVDEIRKIL